MCIFLGLCLLTTAVIYLDFVRDQGEWKSELSVYVDADEPISRVEWGNFTLAIIHDRKCVQNKNYGDILCERL